MAAKSAFAPLSSFAQNGRSPKPALFTCSAVKPGANLSATSTDPSFTEWAQTANIRMSHLSLATFPASATQPSIRGLVATQPIKKNTSLITVPSRSALQATTTADEKAPDQFPLTQSEWRKLPWYARLALQVLSANEAAVHPLQAWTQRLPSAIDVPHHWSDADLVQLQSSRMVSLISKQRQAYRKAFQSIEAALPNCRLSYERFVWAVDSVRSRAFAGPLEPAPFKARLQLAGFIAVNTLVWPCVHVLPWENALNGMLTLRP